MTASFSFRTVRFFGMLYVLSFACNAHLPSMNTWYILPGMQSVVLCACKPCSTDYAWNIPVCLHVMLPIYYAKHIVLRPRTHSYSTYSRAQQLRVEAYSIMYSCLINRPFSAMMSWGEK